MGSVRGQEGMPGLAPLMAQRQESALLIAKGGEQFRSVRLFGVNRRAGTRWLHWRTLTFKSGAELHYQPMTTRATCLSARFLSEAGCGDRLRLNGWQERLASCARRGLGAHC